VVRRTILIAEDDRLLHQMYRDWLGDAHEVLSAYDGVDALIIAADRVPDLLVLDVIMPILDGRTVCSKLRGYAKTQGIRIVMVSGRDDQRDRLLGFEVGADDYLVKPCPRELFLHAVTSQLRKPRP
jgi:DNA-binding response OmpR family regulator